MDVIASPADAAPEAAKSARKHGIADRIAFAIFLLMVFFAPVPDGSVSFFWVEIWVAVAALILVLASYRDVARGHVLIFAGLALVLVAYAVVAWLQSISPGPAPLAIWETASRVLGVDLPPLSGSVVGAPLFFLGRPLLVVTVLAAGMVFGADARRADRLLRMVVYSACVFGLIGLVIKVVFAEGGTAFYQGGALTALFINKNTTATYLGSAFLAGLAILLVPFIKRYREGVPLLGSGADKLPKGTFGLAIATFLLILLLPLTQSRAGLVLTVLIAAGAIGLTIRLRGRVLWAAVIGGVILVALVFAASGDVWRVRQSRLSVDTDVRWQAYRMMWDAIAERPALGYGLGTFTESFPQFRTANLQASGEFNIGHSTPLELAFEGGLPLMILVVSFAGVICAVLVRGVLRRPGDPYILAALLVGLLGALHSSVDFSLQMPGYLILCLAIVGLGVGRSFLPKEPVVRRHLRRQHRRTGGSESSAKPGPSVEIAGNGASVPVSAGPPA